MADRTSDWHWPLHVIDGAGHFLGLDQPEALLRALSAALDRSRGAAR